MGVREIIFRGKRKDNGEWVKGDLIKIKDKYYIRPNANIFQVPNPLSTLIAYFSEVIPETVGQYTGLTDENGNKIFEGDIVYIWCGHGNCVVGKAIVYFDKELLQYRVKEIKPYAYDSEVGDLYKDCDFTHIDEYEVIGNKWDNPELLRGE